MSTQTCGNENEDKEILTVLSRQEIVQALENDVDVGSIIRCIKNEPLDQISHWCLRAAMTRRFTGLHMTVCV